MRSRTYPRPKWMSTPAGATPYRAGFLNTDGGTLLIGVDNSGNALGLDHDYQRVKPPNADGFVNCSPRT